MSDFFTDAGFSLPTGQTAAPPSNSGSLFQSAGFQLPGQKQSGQFSDEIPIPVPGTPGYDTKVNDPASADTLENRIAAFGKAINPVNVASNIAGSWWGNTKNEASSGAQEYQSGLGDIGHSLTASGVGKAALGALQAATSPVSGAFDTLGSGVTQLTGNPEIGQRTAALAGLMLPVKGGSTALKAATEDRAINTIVNTVGPENIPALVADVEANPRLTLMDKSEPLRVMAQGLIDPAQPEAQNIITQNVKNRIATLPAATNTAYTAAMGPSPNVPAMLDRLKQQAQDVGSKLIQPALDNADYVNTTPVIKAIDSEIGADPVGAATLRALKEGKESAFPLSPYQSRLFQLRNQLTPDTSGGSQFLDATGEQGAHAIQSQLRAEASNLLSSSSGAERNLGANLMDMRGKLVDAIDDASGGTYKPALSKYRDAMMVQEAFESGFDTLKNRSGVAGLEDRPDMFQKAIDESSPEEVVARRLGTRLDIDQKLNGVKNTALAGQNIIAPEYNKQKLATLFGEPEANRLIKTIEDTTTEAQTNAKILSGSKTAETLAGQKALEVPKVGGGSFLNWAGVPAAEIAGTYLSGEPGLGTALYGATKGLQLGTQLGMRALGRSRNVAFAKAVSSTSGPVRDQALNALLAHPDVVRASQKSGNALTAMPVGNP